VDKTLHFRQYLGFHLRDFPETSDLELCVQALETGQFWLWSVTNELHLENIVLSGLYLDCQLGSFPATSHIIVSTLALRTLQVWLQSVHI